MRLRRRYGVYPLGVHRREGRIEASLDDIRIRVGDTILLEGDPDDIRRLAEEQRLDELTRPAEQPYRRRRAPIVLAMLAFIVTGGALGLMPIAGLSVIAVALTLVTRCIDADEAFRCHRGADPRADPGDARHRLGAGVDGGGRTHGRPRSRRFWPTCRPGPC